MPSTEDIDPMDDVEDARHEFELAAGSTRCIAYCTGEPLTEWCGHLDADGVGYDGHSLEDLSVGIMAQPLH